MRFSQCNVDVINDANNDLNSSHGAVEISSWLSHAERNFFIVLNRVLDGSAYVFVKVKINDVLKNSILDTDNCSLIDFGDKTFDFVLCDTKDLSVKCVIELDDRPHALQKMHAEFSYESLCNDAGVGLLEIPARCGYPELELKKYLSLYLDFSS